MRHLRDPSLRRDPKRFALDAFQASLQHTALAGIDESREPAFELGI
jgi:hypothetical protein